MRGRENRGAVLRKHVRYEPSNRWQAALYNVIMVLAMRSWAMAESPCGSPCGSARIAATGTGARVWAATHARKEEHGMRKSLRSGGRKQASLTLLWPRALQDQLGEGRFPLPATEKEEEKRTLGDGQKGVGGSKGSWRN